MIYVNDQKIGMIPVPLSQISDEGKNLPAEEPACNVSIENYASVREALGRLGIKATYRAMQSDNFVSGVSGWRIKADGDVEFGSGEFRGTITATAGNIGGFTITATELYGGIIKTAATVGAGNTGVIMDTDGLRGYDSVLGNTFNLPTDGSAPTFSSGIINETIYEISTNAILRTSATVGDGSANSAGVLINNAGVYICEANQVVADANFKALVNGTISLKGSITIIGGSGIANFSDAGDLVTKDESAINTSNITNGAGWTDDTAADAAQADATQAIADAAGAQGTADGKVTTFFQDAAPTAEGTGDLWVDTDDTNKLYRWSGVAWVSVVDTDIATAITNAATAQSTADGKIVTFYQSGIPTATDAGDLWVDTDDKKIYRATNAGDDQITAGEWERIDVGATPSLIDVLQTTNAPAAANADVTSSQFSNNLATIDSEVDKVELGLNASGVLVTKAIPASNVAPSGAGLYLGADYLGYYDSSAWKTYMDSSGNFYLGGSSGKLQWNGTLLSIEGSVDITAGASYNKLEANLPSDENLVGYWAFDEGQGSKAYDGSGNGHDGTLTNMEEADWVDGVAGSCLDFDGTSEYVDLGTASGTLLGNGVTNLSVSLWFKADVTNSDDGLFYIGSFANSNGMLALVVRSGNLEGFVNTASPQLIAAFTDTTIYHHLVFTYDGTDIKIYLDNVEVDTDAYSLGLDLSGLKIIIGGYYSSSYLFDGKIDEVRLYNTALTAKEIYALYKNPSGQPSLAVPMGRLTSGSIYSKQITLAVTGGTGDSYIAGGNNLDLANWRGGDASGGAFILGLDDSDSDKGKFFVGNYSTNDYLKFDGTNVKIACSTSDALTIGYGSDILLTHGGDIKFTSVTAPTALTAALITTAGNIDAGTHKYKVTYVNATGETELGAISNTVTNDATHKQNALTNIPTSSSSSVTSRKIYRTKAGDDDYYLLHTIADNTTTTYTDNTADSGLTGSIANSRTNDSFGKVIVDNIITQNINHSNSFVGWAAGNANTTGYSNVFIGKAAGYVNTSGYGDIFIGEGSGYANTIGRDNTFVGYLSGYTNISGKRNTLIGKQAGYANTNSYGTFVGYKAGFVNTSGEKNTFIGYQAGYINSTGDNNVCLGYEAGYYETGDNKLFIDNASRASEADARVKALVYGMFASDTGNQCLTINGREKVEGVNSGLQWSIENFVTWTGVVTGSGNTYDGYFRMRAYTGSTASSTAVEYLYFYRKGKYNTNFDADMEMEVIFSHEGTSGANGKSYFKFDANNTATNPVNKGFGFRVDNNALKGIIHNGTSLTVVDLNTTLTSTTVRLRLKFTAGSKIEWFVNDVSKGESANVPSGNLATYFTLGVLNGADTADQKAVVGRLAFWEEF